jgi:ribosomal-protein-alanine N-acetyltransferase
MQSIETFFTTHLIGDCLQLEHLDQLCIMHQDPQVMAALGGVRSQEQSKQFFYKIWNTGSVTILGYGCFEIKWII